eukprot:401108-Prymnesium_polylepis.1
MWRAAPWMVELGMMESVFWSTRLALRARLRICILDLGPHSTPGTWNLEFDPSGNSVHPEGPNL